jgi:site-specific DNA-methyltransferase (adenine-specific)/modification methylase
MINNFLNKIIQGDCIEVLKKLPNNSIDLIFADPPYNLQLSKELYRPNQTKVEGVNDKWDKFNSFKEYDEFTYNWLKECKRVLKDNGSFWVIGTYHNIFRVGKIMQDLGYWILNDIVWIKTNPMPNFKGTRFNNAHETLIWATKSEKSKYTFNYKSMKVYNDDKQMRSEWYIPICQGKERLKDENGNKLHSTQKPEELLYRIIISTSKIGDIVLDPFLGSGTTAAVAKKLRRNYIGIEKEEKYIKAAKKRLKYTNVLDSSLLTLKIDEKKPKVPFGNLIESSYIQVGEYLYSKDLKYKAKVLANATIEFNNEIGSIHNISAKILNKSSNNGWKYWYVKRGKDFVLIDEVRNIYLKDRNGI